MMNALFIPELSSKRGGAEFHQDSPHPISYIFLLSSQFSETT